MSIIGHSVYVNKTIIIIIGCGVSDLLWGDKFHCFVMVPAIFNHIILIFGTNLADVMLYQPQ